MPKKIKREKIKEMKVNSDTKLVAFIATFFSIFGFIFALLVRRKNKYVIHYAEQSLIVFIAIVIVWGISSVIWIIPIIGWIIGIIASILVTILWILSWINSLSEEIKEVPLIGHYGKRLQL